MTGTCDDQPFDDLRDLDELTASFFEVLTSTGKYFWIPLERVDTVEFRAWERPRDLLWRRAHMVVRGGPDGEVYLPVLYAGSVCRSGRSDSPGPSDRLARRQRGAGPRHRSAHLPGRQRRSAHPGVEDAFDQCGWLVACSRWWLVCGGRRRLTTICTNQQPTTSHANHQPPPPTTKELMARVRPNQPLVPSVLDRLLDDDPEISREAPASRHQVLRELKMAVRRDLENLLNTRVRCLALPAHCKELNQSLVNYGLPDFTGGQPGAAKEEREEFCAHPASHHSPVRAALQDGDREAPGEPRQRLTGRSAFASTPCCRPTRRPSRSSSTRSCGRTPGISRSRGSRDERRAAALLQPRAVLHPPARRRVRRGPPEDRRPAAPRRGGRAKTRTSSG